VSIDQAERPAPIVIKVCAGADAMKVKPLGAEGCGNGLKKVTKFCLSYLW